MNFNAIGQYLKTAAIIGSILISFAGLVLAFGNRAKEIWLLPETNSTLAASMESLTVSVNNLQRNVEKMSASQDMSPCAEYLRAGNDIDEVRAGERTRITLQIKRLRSDCTVLPPIRAYIIDSDNVFHSVKANFEGKNLPVGLHTVSYLIDTPAEAAPGIAVGSIDVDYELPNGNRRTLSSPDIAFNILIGGVK